MLYGTSDFFIRECQCKDLIVYCSSIVSTWPVVSTGWSSHQPWTTCTWCSCVCDGWSTSTRSMPDSVSAYMMRYKWPLIFPRIRPPTFLSFPASHTWHLNLFIKTPLGLYLRQAFIWRGLYLRKIQKCNWQWCYYVQNRFGILCRVRIGIGLHWHCRSLTCWLGQCFPLNWESMIFPK